MLRNLLLILMAVTIAASVSIARANDADQSKTKVTIPATKTAPVSGNQMYTSYCAPCHGVNGNGKGPKATALKTPPTDLTVLSKNNGGKFPSTHVTSVLQFGIKVPSHGTAEMPAWGPVLGKMNQTNLQERDLRIDNLSRYLETIQAK